MRRGAGYESLVILGDPLEHLNHARSKTISMFVVVVGGRTLGNIDECLDAALGHFQRWCPRRSLDQFDGGFTPSDQRSVGVVTFALGVIGQSFDGLLDVVASQFFSDCDLDHERADRSTKDQRQERNVLGLDD